MANLNKHIFLTIIVIWSSAFTTVFAQRDELIRQIPCTDTMLMRQGDSLRKRFEMDGFTVMMARPISFQNGYELPIIFPLKKGGLYQFAYIGEKTSKLYEFRLTDMEEHLAVKQRKMWGDVDGNIISFAYIPIMPGNYIAKLYQESKLKKETLCGYFLLMKKTKASGLVNE